MAKLIKPANTPQPVTIEFTPQEAQFLRDVMGKVGGNRHSSRRNLADNILAVLREGGYTDYKTEDMEGNISVKDNK